MKSTVGAVLATVTPSRNVSGGFRKSADVSVTMSAPLGSFGGQGKSSGRTQVGFGLAAAFLAAASFRWAAAGFGDIMPAATTAAAVAASRTFHCEAYLMAILPRGERVSRTISTVDQTSLIRPGVFGPLHGVSEENLGAAVRIESKHRL